MKITNHNYGLVGSDYQFILTLIFFTNFSFMYFTLGLVEKSFCLVFKARMNAYS